MHPKYDQGKINIFSQSLTRNSGRFVYSSLRIGKLPCEDNGIGFADGKNDLSSESPEKSNSPAIRFSEVRVFPVLCCDNS